MADQTARAGLPFPEGTDVNDVPADLQALAERVAGLLGAPALSELQRDALDGSDVYDGRLIYNTDQEQLEVRRDSDWLGTGGGGGSVVNTDGDPGTTIYVGTVDPETLAVTLEDGDVWIEVPE